MRGVPEGRGESEYLLCKYSEMPTFQRKVGTPSDPAAPGFARIHRATSPINGGGKIFSAACGIGGTARRPFPTDSIKRFRKT